MKTIVWKPLMMNLFLCIICSILTVLAFSTRCYKLNKCWITIFIIMAFWQHGFPWLSLVISSYCPSLLVCLLDGIKFPRRANECKFLLVSQHCCVCVGVHKWILPISSSWLLQQCSACLAHFTWMVCEMGGKWLYRWCFVKCCFQDLFKTAYIFL